MLLILWYQNTDTKWRHWLWRWLRLW